MLHIPCSTRTLKVTGPRLLGPRVLLLAAVVFASPGCFVLDELDRGGELMDHHSDRPTDVAASPAQSDAFDDAHEAVESARRWWISLSGSESASDPVVDCRLHGSQAFVAESDCLARGGWVRP
jgi:hypothetical protein